MNIIKAINPANFSPEDLIADDWEVYEKQSPMEKGWLQYYNLHPHSLDWHPLDVWEAAWNAAQKHFTSSDKLS